MTASVTNLTQTDRCDGSVLTLWSMGQPTAILRARGVPGVRAGLCAYSGRTSLGAAESWLSSYVRFGPQEGPRNQGHERLLCNQALQGQDKFIYVEDQAPPVLCGRDSPA